MKEYILCAAIHYDDGNEHIHQPVKTGFVVCGLRHHNCISIFSLMKLWDKTEIMKTGVQGFLTNKGRFVDRVGAKIIALDAGQVEEQKLHHSLIGLFSEDLY